MGTPEQNFRTAIDGASDDESLEASLRERADSLLDETPDDAGAGP
jgi:hypothetical protein